MKNSFVLDYSKLLYCSGSNMPLRVVWVFPAFLKLLFVKIPLKFDGSKLFLKIIPITRPTNDEVRWQF